MSVPAPPPLLEAVDLERRYQRHRVWSGVSLTLEPAEVVLLAGPNGAGKSTLLRTLAGLLRPTSGRVLLRGRNLQTEAALRGEIGYLGHATALYRDLTARENLRFAARLHGLTPDQSRLEQALADVDLLDRADERVSRFSRGMAQRLALARVRLHAPRILLLDEPFTGLDHAAAELLRQFVQAGRDAGQAAIVVTHQPGELWQIATRLMILADHGLRHDSVRPAAIADLGQLLHGVAA